MPDYQAHIAREQGLYVAVVLNDEGQEIDRMAFGSLQEAEDFSRKRLSMYQGPFAGTLGAINRCRAALRRLKETAFRQSIKDRFRRDDVL